MKKNIFWFLFFLIFNFTPIYAMKAVKAGKSAKKAKQSSLSKAAGAKGRKKPLTSTQKKVDKRKEKKREEKKKVEKKREEKKKIKREVEKEVRKKIKEKEKPKESIFARVLAKFKKRKEISAKEKIEAVHEVLKSKEISEELKREIGKDLTWEIAKYAGVAVKLKDYDELNWKAILAKDETEVARMQMNAAKKEFGKDSDEYKNAKKEFEALKKISDDAVKRLDEEKKQTIEVALQQKGLDFGVDIALRKKTPEENKAQMIKELEAAGFILSKSEFEKELEKQKNKIEKLENKIAKVEAMKDQGGMAYGEKLPSWKAQLMKERQTAAGLKTGFFRGDIGKLARMDPGKEKYKEFESKIYDKMYVAKGIKEKDVSLLQAKLNASFSDFDKEVMKKELDNSKISNDQKEEIKKELAKIEKNEQIVKSYFDEQVNSAVKDLGLDDSKKKLVREILDDELTKESESLQEINDLIEEAKEYYLGERKKLKKAKKKITFMMFAMGGGIVPTIFMDPIDPSLLEEDGGERGGLTEEEIQKLKMRRAAQAK